MILKAKSLVVIIFFCACNATFGQIENYQYKRSLGEVSDVWHKIMLPHDIFGKALPGLSDLRIYGITSSNDTIEAPYILNRNEDAFSRQQVDFKLINTTSNLKGHYFTFEVPSGMEMNQIELDFEETNFDRYVTLEGSQLQKDWFTILDSARILSIDNSATRYTFSTLSFPSVKYQYLRLFIPIEASRPTLNSAKITEEKRVEGKYIDYPVMAINTYTDKHKQTNVELTLAGIVSISHLKADITDTYDYYRPVTVQYLRDSTNTPKGWKYNYSTITSGILSSLEKNEFRFKSVVTNKLKIIITNNDNAPLHLRDWLVRGNVHELTARFTEPAAYMMVYGNNKAGSANYDIVNFKDKIPTTLTVLTLGPEELLTQPKVSSSSPLFENEAWLWGIMVLMIGLLGWFSLKMIRK